MWERLTRDTKANGLRHITGHRETLNNLLRAGWAVDRDRLFALQHHIDPKAGKQAANMIKVVMRKNDFFNAAKVDSSAHQLLHRTFTAINQDHAITSCYRM